MTSIKTKKYIQELLYHPYVGMRILPFIGDFAGQAENINKSLYEEEVIDKEEFEYIRYLILSIEKSENEKDFRILINTFKKYMNQEE